ncbi:MAG: phosphotransferase [Tateyamaria sp.]|uniref:aminoglycoside phosphotransferase family protein n=1 Tax=Tateyamaria sp. TaxID=1929288 RepID=UPI0032A06009
MPDRSALIDAFLERSDWANLPRKLVAGDASNRRYERLQRGPGDTAILMDAPPQKGEDVRPFVAITTYLRGAGLSAPQVFAQDEVNGFLLIEDLGDDLFARVMVENPALEEPLYQASVDVLVHLHRASAPDLPCYDANVMTERAALAYDWYQFGVAGNVDKAAKNQFATEFSAALSLLDAEPQVLIQRDYHAENLLWLPDRNGPARVGLLDYQDAMLGHPAYDLVSIAQDARRDVAAPIETMMIERYLAATDMDANSFTRAYALLGAQRNLRILGVFARLSLAYGKPHYVDLIPRVWDHIQTNLSHPALADIKPLIDADLPNPTPALLQKLKDQCATIPLP